MEVALFVCWTVVGLLGAFAVESLMTIGPFVLPLALVGAVVCPIVQVRWRVSPRTLAGLLAAPAAPFVWFLVIRALRPDLSVPVGYDSMPGPQVTVPVVGAFLLLATVSFVLLGFYGRQRAG